VNGATSRVLQDAVLQGKQLCFLGAENRFFMGTVDTHGQACGWVRDGDRLIHVATSTALGDLLVAGANGFLHTSTPLCICMDNEGKLRLLETCDMRSCRWMTGAAAWRGWLVFVANLLCLPFLLSRPSHMCCRERADPCCPSRAGKLHRDSDDVCAPVRPAAGAASAAALLRTRRAGMRQDAHVHPLFVPPAQQHRLPVHGQVGPRARTLCR